MDTVNSDRITRTCLMANVALLMAKRSTCRRASVGCVITRDNRIIATGYNGPERGEPHCSDEFCDIKKPCIRSVHAEKNAIRFADSNGISLLGTRLYTTHEPCVECSNLIIGSGISSVLFIYPYRNSGYKLLRKAWITSERYNEEVYVK